MSTIYTHWNFLKTIIFSLPLAKWGGWQFFGLFACLLLLLLLSRFSRVRLCVTPRRQPTRLPRPRDSPGKNTGVGCHFLLQCMKVKSESEVAQSCPTLRDPMDCRLLRPRDLPGKSTGVGCHCLLPHTYKTTGKTIALTRWTLLAK